MWFTDFIYKLFHGKKKNNEYESGVPLFTNNNNNNNKYQTKIIIFEKVYKNDFLSEYQIRQYVENLETQDLIDIIIYYNMKLQEIALLQSEQ